MTDQPQRLDLDTIEARANAATAGPWEIEWDTDDVSDVPFPVGIGPIGYLEHRGDREFADAEFIAAARTDVPVLLAEIRRLTAELQQARQQTTHDPIECDHQAEAGQLAEQMTQLRATIAAEIRHFCPDHGNADTCRMDCHCAIADELARPAAVPAA